MDGVLNRVRVRSGLTRELHPFMKLSPWLVMYYMTEAIEYPRPSLGRQVHYLGPSNDLRRGDQEIPFPWEWLDDRPLVLLSFGTIFINQPAFYRRAVAASRGQPWQLVIRVGPGFDRSSMTDAPENVLFVTEQPLLRLLDRASAMISHAGVNSCVEALERGVPVVLAPVAVDQRDAAERVVRAGAGLRIDRRRADAGTIRSSVRRVLHDPSFRRHAERVAADFAKCNAPLTGAHLVERLAETGQPVLRPAGAPPTIYATPEPTA
jgi:MGT family glycosyltransferase